MQTIGEITDVLDEGKSLTGDEFFDRINGMAVTVFTDVQYAAAYI